MIKLLIFYLNFRQSVKYIRRSRTSVGCRGFSCFLKSGTGVGCRGFSCFLGNRTGVGCRGFSCFLGSGMGRDFLKNRTIQEGGNETGCREAVDEGQRKNLAETVKAEKSDDVSRSYSESPRENRER